MVRGTGAVFVAWLATGCAKPLDTGVVLTPSTLSTADPTVCERPLAAAREPRPFTGEPWTSGCEAIALFSARAGAFGVDEATSSCRGSGVVALGVRAAAAIPQRCVARLARDAGPILASVGRTGRAPHSDLSEAHAAPPAAVGSVAPRLARLPLESFRRDPVLLGPDCSF